MGIDNDWKERYIRLEMSHGGQNEGHRNEPPVAGKSDRQVQRMTPNAASGAEPHARAADDAELETTGPT